MRLGSFASGFFVAALVLGGRTCFAQESPELRQVYAKLDAAGIRTAQVIPIDAVPFEDGLHRVSLETLADARAIVKDLAAAGISVDSPLHFFVDPRGHLLVELGKKARLVDSHQLDEGMKSAGDLADRIATMLRQRGLDVKADGTPEPVRAVERALGRKLATAERGKIDELVKHGTSVLRALDEIGIGATREERAAIVARTEVGLPLGDAPSGRMTMTRDDGTVTLSLGPEPPPLAPRSDAPSGRMTMSRSAGLSGVLAERVDGARAKIEGKDADRE